MQLEHPWQQGIEQSKSFLSISVREMHFQTDLYVIPLGSTNQQQPTEKENLGTGSTNPRFKGPLCDYEQKLKSESYSKVCK